jgi:nitrogen-specific signal transduction histidine kinase
MKVNKYGINPFYFFITTLICSIPFLLYLFGLNFNYSNRIVNLSDIQVLNELASNEILTPLLKGKFIHTFIVSFSITIAFVTTILSFVDYFIKKNASTPIVGIALFCAGMLDLVHIISADQIIDYQLSDIYISSFTWLFSRVFHALILMFGVSVFLLQRKDTFIEEYKSERYFIGFIAIIFLLLSVNAVLIITDESIQTPQMVFPNALISHPYDLIPLALYLISGFFVFPKFYNENKSTFSQTLILSLIPSVIAQLHMAFGSVEIYDYHFFAAQLLKSISYIVPFIGLTINYIDTYKNESKVTEELDIQLKSNEEIQNTLVGVLDASLNGIMALAPIKDENDEVVDFRWTMVNNRAIIDMQYSYEQLMSNSFYQILPTGAFLFEKYKKVYLTGQPDRFTIFGDRTKSHYDIYVTKFADSVAVTFMDITDQIIGQEAILNYQKIQSANKFARLMTHEIRNPLTNILLSVEQLKEEIQENESTGLYIDILKRNTLRINELISEVMNASKLTELEFSTISSRLFILSCIEAAKDRLKLKNIKLDLNIALDIEIEIDIEKMKIAILNIILNAIEAMDTVDGKLTIHSTVEKEELLIEIIDNGVGISEENQHRLFEPFYTNKTKGFGIGLTASQTIIFNHHGNIKLKSELGKGSNFMVKIPIKARRNES